MSAAPKIDAPMTAMTKSDQTFSKEQEAFFSWVSSRKASDGESALVVSVAGSGKTTAVAEAARRKKDKGTVAYFTFGKVAVAELERRLPAGSKVQTLHGLALGALHKMGHVEVDKEKGIRIAKAVERFDYKRRRVLMRAIGLAKNSLCETKRDVRRLLHASEFFVPGGKENETAFVADVVEALSISLEDAGNVDFDDMVWFAARSEEARPRTYDWIVVDEGQDTNPAQIVVLGRAVAKGGRIVVVGDPKQAVYQFRGATSGAMGELMEAAGGVDPKEFRFPLSYRASKAVAAYVRKETTVEDFRALEDAPEGSVTFQSEERASSLLAGGWAPGDFVISRTNAPLVEHGLKALAQGIPATLLGRGLGEQLKFFVEGFPGTTAAEVMRGAATWLSEETAVLQESGESTAGAEDRFRCLQVLAEGVKTKEEIVARIDCLFRDDGFASEKQIAFSTIHQAKGLERDRVFVLRSSFGRGIETEADENLWYVAITRSKRDLILVGDFGSEEE